MLVWQAIHARLSGGPDSDGLDFDLPRGLKTDRVSTRVTLLRRIRMHRARPPGGRDDGSKGLMGDDRRTSSSGTRQRVIVRGLVSVHAGQGSRRLDALKNHIRYLGRSGARYEGERPIFFDRVDDNVAALQRVEEWREDPRHFRFMISPEHGDRITDMRDYVRTLFARVADDFGEPELDWFGICHFDTSYNSGPTRVAALGRVPSIPETQQYVERVIDCYLALTAGRRVVASRECRPLEAAP